MATAELCVKGPEVTDIERAPVEERKTTKKHSTLFTVLKG